MRQFILKMAAIVSLIGTVMLLDDIIMNIIPMISLVALAAAAWFTFMLFRASMKKSARRHRRQPQRAYAHRPAAAAAAPKLRVHVNNGPRGPRAA